MSIMSASKPSSPSNSVPAFPASNQMSAVAEGVLAVEEAKAAFLRGDVATGTRALRRALRIEPQKLDRLVMLGRELYKAGRPKAGATAMQAIADKGAPPAVLLKGAYVEGRWGDATRALSLFDGALAGLKPDQVPEARERMALSLMTAGKVEPAIGVLMPPGAAVPDDTRTENLLAKAARLLAGSVTGRETVQAEQADAIRRLRMAARINRTDPCWAVTLAQLLAATGRGPDALSALEEVEDRLGDEPALLSKAAVVEIGLGRPEAARAHLARAIERSGETAPAAWRVRLATLLNTEGQLEAAAAALAPIAAGPEPQATHRIFLARLLYRLGRWSEAIEQVTAAINSHNGPHPVWEAMRNEIEMRRASGGKAVDLETSPAFTDAVYLTSDVYGRSWENSPYADAWRRLPDLLGQAPGPVLDIGCGPGQFAEFLLGRRPEIDYTGLDFSAVAVEQASRRCPGARFIQGDALRGDFLDRLSYRTVLALEVLEHVQEDLALLARLREGTRVIASVPNFDSFGHVRVFRDEAMVAARYGELIEDITVSTIPLSSTSALFLMIGRRSRAGASA